MRVRSERRRWSGRDDLCTQVQKLWDSGQIQRCLIEPDSLFPRRLILRQPTSSEILDQFDAVRVWAREITGAPHYSVKLRRWNHRVFGENELPQEVWIESVDDAIALIGMAKEASSLTSCAQSIRERRPEVLKWLASKPHQAIELANDWGRLLDVVDWMVAHPKPGIYLRQIDLPGIDTKFVESHCAVLAELFDLVLAPSAIAEEFSRTTSFAKRYGFLDKPLRVRFRILDQAIGLFDGFGLGDITLDVGSFAQLRPKVSRILITENEVNFLAFPNVQGGIVIFGAGYGFEKLSNVDWMTRSPIYYWGDIDTHGFAILDQLRSLYPDVRSFLMDRATLTEFSEFWGREERQTVRDLPRLTRDELALYDDLRDNRFRPNLRLEQEKIGFRWIERALASLPDGQSSSKPPYAAPGLR